MTKPPTVSVHSTESNSLGCLFFIIMVPIGLWIAFYPEPYELAVGIAMVLPPLAFLLAGRGKQPDAFYKQLPWRRILYVFSLFLVMGLAYRWWDEYRYSLMLPLPWVIASLLCALALLLAAHLYRPSGDFFVWRTVLVMLYSGSTLGLVNTHFDASTPVYVQGIVVYDDPHVGNGEYAIIAPDSDGTEHMVPLSWDVSEVLELHAPVCTTGHSGRLGWSWASRAPGLCPVPDAQVRVEQLQQKALLGISLAPVSSRDVISTGLSEAQGLAVIAGRDRNDPEIAQKYEQLDSLCPDASPSTADLVVTMQETLRQRLDIDYDIVDLLDEYIRAQTAMVIGHGRESRCAVTGGILVTQVIDGTQKINGK